MSHILDILEEMHGEVIGGIFSSILEVDGVKKIRPIGSFNESEAFIDSENLIRNVFYGPIALKLVEKFPELKYVLVNRILFIENLDEKPKSKNRKPIYAKTQKSPKYFPELLGIDYIIKFYKMNIEDMHMEQLIALLYSQLRLTITGEYDLIGFENVIATFGKDWASTVAQLPNLLGKDFKSWWDLSRSDKQISIFERDESYLKAAR